MGIEQYKGLAQLFPEPGITVSGKKYDETKDEVFLKYTNKSLPIKAKKTRNTIAPFTGAMTRTLAIHLSKRAMFGAKPSDITALSNMTITNAVDALLNNTPNPMDVPVNYYQNIYPDTTGVLLGDTWINAPYGDGSDNYYRMLSYKALWIRAIIEQNISIHEKMVVFLSNFTPIGTSNIGDARFEYKYLMLIKQYALGNYKDFVRDLTKDGAMLYYLNGYINNKYSPDENYARELQELFTVGKEGGQKYLETDVVQAAKLLTGWRVDGTAINTFFDPTYHDTSNKTFSAFYNNKVITGQAGPNGGAQELDDLLDMLFSGQSAIETAKHLCRNLYRFFMHYDIDATIEQNIILPLSQTFINSNWELKPVLEQLFKSSHFFDNLNLGAQIKNPIDLVLGTVRSMSIEVNPSSNIEEFYGSYNTLYYITRSMGMELADPPNVSGFKAYYQIPSFHELWVNSDTYPKRLRFSDRLVASYGYYVSPNVQYVADLPAFAATLSNPGDPDSLVNECIELLYGLPVSQTTKDKLKGYLLGNQTANTYWTTAWNNHINNPADQAALNVVKNRLRLLLTELMRRAEYHLC